MESLPSAPAIVSLPPSAMITSAPLVPVILSSPAVPMIVGALPLHSGGATPIAAIRVVVALGPPLRDTVWPVKTTDVDVPLELVSVRVAV
jgi:hypothetical protein